MPLRAGTIGHPQDGDGLSLGLGEYVIVFSGGSFVYCSQAVQMLLKSVDEFLEQSICVVYGCPIDLHQWHMYRLLHLVSPLQHDTLDDVASIGLKFSDQVGSFGLYPSPERLHCAGA